MILRKTKALLVIFLLMTTKMVAQDIIYQDYRKFRVILDNSDELLENGKYNRCIKSLKTYSETQIPYGLRKSYYSNLGECYLQLGKFDLSKENYEKSFWAGLNSKYFEYLNSTVPTDQKEKTAFLKQLKTSYDSICQLLMNSNYLDRKEIILSITNADQEVRNNYLNSSNKDPDNLKILNDLVLETDSINQFIYDSICSIYGWIGRDMVLPELRNIHIVLFHASEEFRNRYIQIGYNQATKNKADWKEIEILQSYSIFRNIMLNKNSGTTIFKFGGSQKLDFSFLDFVCYSLCYEISDGGNYNGKDKKVCINICTDKTQTVKFKQIEKRILKVFKDFGLDKSKYSFVETDNQGTGEIKITFV